MYDLDFMILTDLTLVLCLLLDIILSFIIYSSSYNLWLNILYAGSPGLAIPATLHPSLPLDLLYYPTGKRQYT